MAGNPINEAVLPLPAILMASSTADLAPDASKTRGTPAPFVPSMMMEAPVMAPMQQHQALPHELYD